MKTTLHQKLTILILIFISTGNFTKGQAPKQVDISPASPNAAQLGIYGTVPVGLFTGTIQESISIYELKTKNLSLPISLNYSSNGLIVDKVASWVGLDWSLNAGGVITLTVKGAKDLHSKSRAGVPANVQNGGTDLLNFLEGSYPANDFQPDIYSYNFVGNTGKFILDSDGLQAYTIPFNKIEITTTIPGRNMMYGDDFIIRTPDGIKYIFSAVESFYCHYCPTQPTYNTSWFLTSIIHPAGDVINFYYSPNSESYYTGISQEVVKMLNYNNDCPGGGCPEPINITKALGATIQTVYLDSISATGAGTVVFEKSKGRLDYTDGKKLDKIIIKNSKNQIIKKVEFQYSFIQANQFYLKGSPMLDDGSIQGQQYTTEINYRMFLDEVKFLDRLNSEVYSYSFQYLNLNTIPSRLSFSQDFWGFFNGKINNAFVPSGIATNPPFIGIGGDRNADGNFSKNGMLSRIDYPTGGYSVIEYEPNSSDGITVGGCRVKRVLTYAQASSTPQIKRYYYNIRSDINTSHGHFSPPWAYYTEYNTYAQCQVLESFNTCNWGMLFSNSQASLFYGNYGSSILYPAVTVSYGETFEGGGETHYFHAENDVPAQNINTPYGRIVLPGEYTNDGWYAGTKASEIYFKKNPSGLFVNVRSVEYDYIFEDTRNYKNYRCLAVTKRQVPQPTPLYWIILADYDVGLYYIKSIWLQPYSKIIKDYDEAGNTTSTTTIYNYGEEAHAQLTEETTSTSIQGETITKKYYYPQDYNQGVSNTSTLITKFMLAKCLDSRIYRDGHLTLLEQFKYNDNGLFTNYYLAELGDLSPDIPLNAAQPYTTTQKESYSYDNYSNLKMVEPEDNNKTSFIWGYSNTYPVIKCENIDQSLLITAVNNSLPSGFGTLEDLLFDSDGIGNMTTENQKSLWKIFCENLIKQEILSNTKISLYTYIPQIGISSQTDSNCLTTYYEYDSFGRLKLIRDDDGRILRSIEYNYK